MSSPLITRLAAEAERDGWRQAARTVLRNEPELFSYVSDERSGDWRFILPRMPFGHALCVGGALSPVPLVLAQTCNFVEVSCDAAEGRFLMARARQEGVLNLGILPDARARSWHYDLVAGLRPHAGSSRRAQNLTELAGAVKAGGALYLEMPEPALLKPPALLRKRLKRLGLKAVRTYWPKPTFRRCEMLFPLGDRRLQSYYLDNQFFALSPGKRALQLLLKLTVVAGLFELTLPEYLVVATKRGQVSA